jgi:hypothetical protein
MAYPSPQAPAAVLAPRSRPGRARTLAKTLPDILFLPLLMLFGFLLCYLLPFHAPAPHGVKVAVAGWVSAAEVGAGLDQQVPGAFDVIPVSDPGQARQQVLDQAAQAAFIINGGQATLYTAKADGNLLANTVVAAFTPVAQAENLTLHLVDLVPTVPDDATGNSLFYLALAWSLTPYLLAVSLLMGGTTLSLGTKLSVVAAMGTFASILGFLIAYWLGPVPGQALPILYGFLGFEAIALTVLGLGPFVGKYIIPVALTLFVFLSVPSSGGPVPDQMVPTFFNWLHTIMPLGNLIDAMRSIFYFDGTNMIRPTLVLCTWIALGATLITLSALLHRARQRPAPAAASAGPPLGELPGPAAAAPAVLQAPIVHPGPAASSASGTGHWPSMLFGTVTEATGAPIPGANITIIDAHGHQVMRTSSDSNGRYAADGLPGDILTVLLSPPGQMPVATRVMLTSEHPVRHDFVLPYPTQDARRDAGVLYRT